MVKALIYDSGKGIPQAVCAENAGITRGAFEDGGNFIADKERNYDGVNAVIDKKEKEFETILKGEIYNRIPTRVGEEYATTEVTSANAMTAGTTACVVSSGKLVAAGQNETGTWLYLGTYANPFGLTMYRVRRIG